MPAELAIEAIGTLSSTMGKAFGRSGSAGGGQVLAWQRAEDEAAKEGCTADYVRMEVARVGVLLACAGVLRLLAARRGGRACARTGCARCSSRASRASSPEAAKVAGGVRGEPREPWWRWLSCCCSPVRRAGGEVRVGLEAVPDGRLLARVRPRVQARAEGAPAQGTARRRFLALSAGVAGLLLATTLAVRGGAHTV